MAHPLSYNADMKFELESPIAILGFGIEGKAALEFLKSKGINDVTICDQNPNIKCPKNVKGRFGKNAFDDLSNFRTIFRSPGVRYDLPGIQQARELGCHITSLTKLTLEHASDRITAITGTNGKETAI